MNKRSFAVAFTGHRPESLPFSIDEQDEMYCKIKELLLKEILLWASEGYENFYGGMARGMDIVFGEQVLAAKHQGNSNVRFVGVIPYEEQSARWNEAWRKRYFALMKSADDEILMSRRYDANCYHRRNRYMVDNADILIAVYNGSMSGGTAYTVKYAREKKKTVVVLDVNNLTRFVMS